ncbi:MAG: hypothetical protein ACSHWZ_17380 [Sulfitobacter sp.]
MTFAKFTRPAGDKTRAPMFDGAFDCAYDKSGFALTVQDRLGIERLVAQDAPRHLPHPALSAGLLRHKLRISRGAMEPPEPSLVVSGARVTYMMSGGGAQSGVLRMGHEAAPGEIPVASLLGATLIGMRALQKLPMLRDDGEIVALVVLDVAPRSLRCAY